MKTVPLFCLLALLTLACRKEALHVDTDIEVREPVITTLDDGRKQVDFTVVVTQIGNHFLQDFALKFSKSYHSTVLDSFHTVLPTAREFVRHTIMVDQPGTYYVDVMIGTPGNGASVGRPVKVPE